jgi:hypothetical protein
MDYPTAPPTVGKPNGIVISPPRSTTVKPLQNVANGIDDQTAHAPDGKRTTAPLPSVQHARPDYRQPHNHGKTYYCLKRFMGSFEQSGCCRFIIDPDNDKCLYQTFVGTCDRGGDE